jgi:hypothetical protein
MGIMKTPGSPLLADRPSTRPKRRSDLCSPTTTSVKDPLEKLLQPVTQNNRQPGSVTPRDYRDASCCTASPCRQVPDRAKSHSVFSALHCHVSEDEGGQRRVHARVMQPKTRTGGLRSLRTVVVIGRARSTRQTSSCREQGRRPEGLEGLRRWLTGDRNGSS